MSAEKAVIVFYDIASDKPLRTFAPNPWKTRLLLNFKGIPYCTEWVDMPDIAKVRQDLGVQANRTLPNGEPYHTLPLIHDKTTGALVGDTFEIALYMDKQYPDSPKLFGPYTVGLTAALNAQIDGIFTKHVSLASQMPFDPVVKGRVYEMFAKRMENATLPPPVTKEKTLESLELALGELAKSYQHMGGTTDYLLRPTGTAKAQCQHAGREDGLFLDGDEPVYADFIVGAWLKMFEASMPAEDWDRVKQFQGGRWARLVEALAQWTEMK